MLLDEATRMKLRRTNSRLGRVSVVDKEVLAMKGECDGPSDIKVSRKTQIREDTRVPDAVDAPQAARYAPSTSGRTAFR